MKFERSRSVCMLLAAAALAGGGAVGEVQDAAVRVAAVWAVGAWE